MKHKHSNITFANKHHKQVRTTLILLTRNEIAGISSLIKTIPFSAVDEYFAVDYRSTDGTKEFFESHHVPVIRQTIPGRAEAFRLAVKHARGTYLIFFSPDGNENPADIPQLIHLLEAGNDLAIASRFMKHSRNEEDDQLFKWRAWANRAFTFLANLLFNRTQPYVTDSINGYRAITRNAFDELHLDGTGFVIEYQMTIRAMKKHMKVSEIPTTEGNRIGGSSTSYAIPTGLQFLWHLFREISIGAKF